MDMQDDTTQKKLRVGGHDFIVAVGSGVTYREYSCYKILLANGSDYFDNMFGNHCLESANNRVYFKDIDPSEWELLYGFIVPDKDPTNRPVLDRDNFSTLLPFYFIYFRWNRILTNAMLLSVKLYRAVIVMTDVSVRETYQLVSGVLVVMLTAMNNERIILI